MKRAIDVTVAAIGLAVLTPLLAVVALAIVLDSSGPVFFRQERVGFHGRHFKLWKFRTMQPDAAQAGPMLTERDDPRITRMGRLLRRWKVDEFPQMINVLIGDMSLVGPRPELPQLVAFYTEQERMVLTVRPGITGPSQLAFRDEDERVPPGVDIVQYHVEHILRPKLLGDLAYVEQHSTCRDFGILFRTLAVLVRRR
ncbi:MAG: sugar transferase [Candidatus Binatia bacterium]